MKGFGAKLFGMAAIVGGIAFLLAQNPAWAHCDTLDGPVITDARKALTSEDATPALKWVKVEDEGEVRQAFERALSVQNLGPEAKELAELYFFETLVRVHRAGEGAPYTGLKPAGNVEPPIAAVDKALEIGTVDDLAAHVLESVETGLRKHFEYAIEAKESQDKSVEAGRNYVEAYVFFAHYVEGLHNAIGGSRHHGEGAENGEHQN